MKTQFLKNTFFTSSIYNNKSSLSITEEMLNSIFSVHIKPADLLNIRFVFLTDTHAKAVSLEVYLKTFVEGVSEIKLAKAGICWEITGISDKIRMEVQAINDWNRIMWDIGYAYDCMLDGWEILG